MTGLPQTLLDAILNDFEDDAPRLAAADWLEEQGRPDDAAFMRLQLRLAAAGADALPPAERTRLEVAARAAEVLHRERWLDEPLSEVGAAVVFAEFGRGFLTVLNLRGDGRRAGEILAALAAFPLLERAGVELDPAAPPTILVELPVLERLTHFQATIEGEPHHTELGALAACPRLLEIPFLEGQGEIWEHILIERARRLEVMPVRGTARALGGAVTWLPGGRLGIDLSLRPWLSFGPDALARLLGLTAVTVAGPAVPEWLSAHPDLRTLVLSGLEVFDPDPLRGLARLRYVSVEFGEVTPDWDAVVGWLLTLPDLASARLLGPAGGRGRRLAELAARPALRRLDVGSGTPEPFDPGRLIEFRSDDLRMEFIKPDNRIRAMSWGFELFPRERDALERAGVWFANGDICGAPPSRECVAGGLSLRIPDWFEPVAPPATSGDVETLGAWCEWGDGDPIDRAIPGGPAWLILERLPMPVPADEAIPALVGSPGPLGRVRKWGSPQVASGERRVGLAGNCGCAAHARFLWPARRLRLRLEVPSERPWPTLELAAWVADSIER